MTRYVSIALADLMADVQVALDASHLRELHAPIVADLRRVVFAHLASVGPTATAPQPLPPADADLRIDLLVSGGGVVAHRHSYRVSAERHGKQTATHADKCGGSVA